MKVQADYCQNLSEIVNKVRYFKDNCVNNENNIFYMLKLQ